MRLTNQVSPPLNPAGLKSVPPARRRRRRFFLVVMVAAALAMLACSVLRPSSGRSADLLAERTRLPTFTRTPLPTFTPTTMAAPAGGTTIPEARPVVSTLPPAAANTAIESNTPMAVSTPLPTFTPLPEAAALSFTSPTPNVFAPPVETAGPAPETGVDPSPLPPTATAPPPAAPDPGEKSRPPTPFPTPGASLTPPPDSPTPTATVTQTPISLPTPAPDGEGWVFSAVQAVPAQDQSSLLVYGELVNDTGATQVLGAINGVFYDAQGQVLTGENVSGTWPDDAVPPGGKLPFRLTAPGLQSVANVDLQVEATPSTMTVHQDLQFTSLKPSIENGVHCFSGQLQNPDGEPLSTVMIAFILYDRQKNVINFNSDHRPFPQNQTLDFEVCIDSFDQTVTRTDFRVWGYNL